ncbi:MAG: DUF349 domain-containing protein [Balneolaceae bacterium]|nr:DUF349 domain-containing protein [Balneolaceae bacterium]
MDEEKPTTDSQEHKGLEYYRDLADKAESLASQSDWPYVSMELDNVSRQWEEGPGVEEEEAREELYRRVVEATEQFEERKKEHYRRQKEQKRENLDRKNKLLDDLQEIVDAKNWSATGKVKKIRGEWSSTGRLPKDASEDELEKRFSKLVNEFNDHKVDRLVEQRQKEEDNLMLKLSVLDKMERVAGSIDAETENWKQVDRKFDDLTNQWKKIGRVPGEKADEVWGRYKAAQDDYYDLIYEHNPKHREKVDKFYGKKEQVIREAEALLEADDLAKAAQKINRLHRRWKKIGNLPQRQEDELWARFKSASDAFNDRKSDNMDQLREQEEKHFEQKLELIEQAEAIKDTNEWDEGHSKMQQLMDRWKAIGPVPRKKSNKIWKKFKGAMDVFYDRRRAHFKEVKEERRDNLEEKKEILQKLQELGRHDDPIEAVNQAKPLQEKFKEAGYVPIKKKNKIWKKYREACDVIYERFRAAKSGDKFDQELAKADLDPKERSQIQDLRKEFKKMKGEVRRLEDKVLQIKEKKTYFTSSDDDNPLMKEIQEKIDKAERKLETKRDRMDELAGRMEEIGEDD